VVLVNKQLLANLLRADAPEFIGNPAPTQPVQCGQVIRLNGALGGKRLNGDFAVGV
jgi:hypothetical protein